MTAVTAAAVSAASTAVTAMTAAAVATTAAAVANKLHERGRSVAFLFEDVERRQADVSDFLLVQSEGMVVRGVLSLQAGCWHARKC